MYHNEAYEVLHIKEGSSMNEIKKAYRLLALRYHPDKFDGDPALFLRVKEAYELLCSCEDKDRDRGYQGILASLMQNERFNDIIMHIVMQAESKGLELFASVSRVKQVAIYKILLLYKDYLHLSESFLKGCVDILNKKDTEIDLSEYYVLNPSIEDLFGHCVYKLQGTTDKGTTTTKEFEYIPLWHRRVIIGSIAVDCVYELPVWIQVDAENNVHLHVQKNVIELLDAEKLVIYVCDGVVYEVPGSMLRLVRSQTVVLPKCGIPVAQKDDIYDDGVLSDVVIHLQLL
jgi:hypothetical protein